MLSNKCQGCPPIEIITQDRDNKEARKTSIDSFVSRNEPHKVTVIFAEANFIRHCDHCRQLFTDKFQMPELWWTDWCKRSNGYFGCEEMVDEKGETEAHSTWLRFLIKHCSDNPTKGYFWYKLNIFTRWEYSTKSTTILVFDPKPAVRAHLAEKLFDSRKGLDAEDPYWPHCILAEEAVHLQDDAVWSIRTFVRNLEKNRPSRQNLVPNYADRHELARHAIHVLETLELGTKTINDMIIQHDRLQRGTDTAHHRQISRQLQFLHHTMRSLYCRSDSNKERLLNENQLAFHVMAQFDSEMSVEIGHAAQSDSAAMKTIAVLTLIFLPATFVSAIFSTSFFNFDAGSGDWGMSDKFWMFWAVSIPITLVTVAMWLLWHKFFPQKLIGEEDLRARRRATQLDSLHHAALVELAKKGGEKDVGKMV
ncbi:hypothetical protein ASPZODRAFT_126502 [Penicilliopsis zonata CBS 506.65]|uniref:Uncharacterized protein n=1 Tax=Penicilliopsis zonata CBS 506.65 TaxID=1073090 RepID=A0A1L9STT8_9EURO|nr:hypothetical protein ASPZODRAFT_126502 [Penicilliopsis zonata CBS 506.65]OJJ50609.1 hypothetical protein ASPZODRAFT_126502 [Penicilliopsis zonata CBS 506.65]